MATNFEGMTQEEIAGHFWDAQSSQIASGSDYAGTAGRTKFITDYSGSFRTYELSGAKTILDLQDEMSGIQTRQAAEDLSFFVDQETANIQLEEKWWNDEGWTDESGEYVESSVEMRTRQNDEMNNILDRTRQNEITTIVQEFTETKEAAQFKKQRSGVNVHQGADELRATLWSQVEGIKDKYSDAKENSQKDLDRTIKDNRLNITRGYEDIAEGTKRRELAATQAGESAIVNNLGNKEEAMARFGTEMWDTLRRLQNAGIFNEPIADYVPPVDTGTDYGQFTNFFSPSKWRLSDARVKENIEYLNTSPDGYRIYAFNYKSSDAIRCKGVMAQDVLIINKDAVKNIDGILHVDYSQIDINMEIINDKAGI